ncbi:MAG: SagB/ThcOx family dehydrogenase [Euryarchaeota archaeon]|nr:SagB/ThcOx family dehydrogenase [Euryarchaeota archaeon]
MARVVKLPAPRLEAGTSVEEAIYRRRSVREFREGSLSLQEISQLLWAAQGITDRRRGLRSVPSAGALYPLEVYGVTRDWSFHYDPGQHSIREVAGRDARRQLWTAALRQDFLLEAPLVVVIAAVFERTARKYGDRGTRYVFTEAGHAAQNIHLQAVSLGLDSVPVGAFYDEKVRAALAMPVDHHPVYLVAVGRKRG